MYNMESRRFSGEEKLTEKSVEDFHSNSDTQTVVSQRYHPNSVESKSLLTSINKHENNHPVASTVERAEEQTEKYKNNKTVSNINKTTQNHSKVNFFFLFVFFYFFIFDD